LNLSSKNESEKVTTEKLITPDKDIRKYDENNIEGTLRSTHA
jgi:hypothetical protein